MSTAEFIESKYGFQTYPLCELERIRISKSEAFKEFPHAFDYALPQGWLDSFAEWCEANRPAVSYHLILSSTVWAYPADQSVCSGSYPVTCCDEVLEAMLQWFSRG